MDAAAVYEVLLCDGTRDAAPSSVMRRVNEGIYFAVMVTTYCYQILNYFLISVELNSSRVLFNLRKFEKGVKVRHTVKEVIFSEVEGSFLRQK